MDLIFIFTRQTAFDKTFSMYIHCYYVYVGTNTQDQCQALYDLLPHQRGEALEERGYNFTIPGSEMS